MKRFIFCKSIDIFTIDCTMYESLLITVFLVAIFSNLIQMNNLIKRWNKPDSQANFYLKSGLGNAYSDKGRFDSKNGIAGFAGISTDWEDQRYFIQYANRYTYAAEIDKFYTQSLHFGITPYIGDYGDIHTWLMMKIDLRSKDIYFTLVHITL